MGFSSDGTYVPSSDEQSEEIPEQDDADMDFDPTQSTVEGSLGGSGGLFHS